MSDSVVKGKPGRKPLSPEGEKRVTVSTSVEASVYAELEEIRWGNRINTMGEVVRQAIEQYVAAYKLGALAKPHTGGPAPE